MFHTPSEAAPFYVVMNAGSGDRDADTPEKIIGEVFLRAGRTYRILRVGGNSRISDVMLSGTFSC